MTTKSPFATYVITQPCVGVKDGTCVEVCPVDCIHTRPEEEQFYIDPAVCIACEQCVLVCPVEAIFLENEVPAQWSDYTEKNADFFARTKEVVSAVPVKQAQRMVQAGHAKAAELGIAVAIAVVDVEGRLTTSGAMEGARPESTEIALNKAYSAAVFQVPTSQLTPRSAEGAPNGVDRARIIAQAGGIPVLDGPTVIGAVGSGGGSPQQDQECCRAAVAALEPAP